MKKRINFTKRLLSVIITTTIFLMSSCTNDITEAVAPAERIDFTINGGITSQLNLENSDLSLYQKTNNPIFNGEEYNITLDLGANTKLVLTLYNRNFQQPLEADFQYSAFTLEQLNDKFAYIVADYYINEGLTYSSVASNVMGKSQLNVFNSTDKGNSYLIRLNGIKLYWASEDGRSTNNTITFDGTFTLNK